MGQAGGIYGAASGGDSGNDLGAGGISGVESVGMVLFGR